MPFQTFLGAERYAIKGSTLHDVWSRDKESVRFYTTIMSQMAKVDDERDETHVLVDCDYMGYRITFHADGTVTSGAF